MLSTKTTDTTDITKAVFSEDDWWLVPAEYVNQFVSKDRESVIVHQCHDWNKDSRNEAGLHYNNLGYWSLAENVETPCKLCNHSPPESIVQLFLLHNFDTFHKDDKMGRMVYSGINKAFQEYEKEYFIGAHYAEIGEE